MTKTDTQSDEKIRFLQSVSTNKEVLPLPEKMLPTNIIQHESLPKATERKGKRPAPNPSVYDFPKEYWPSSDTELVPADMSANQLLMECSREKRRKKENHSNSAVEPHLSSLDLVNALRRTERLPIVFLKQNLSIVKQALSYPDSTIFEQKITEKRKTFVETLKDVFAERNIGDSPDIDCPEQLTREIGRRLRLCLMGTRTFKSIPYTIDLTNVKIKSDVTETRTTNIYQQSSSEVGV
ncbi:uncharacterized protein LOC127698581 [Mytilus californianus]|uniref:uncharacterized protein LOC127698581 n=1 Tax=Mytilus californianus TaxID=6549 RepID=UPI002245FAB5|nr:uncharacterized protein LOC127698581 [Mytilus californianus]